VFVQFASIYPYQKTVVSFNAPVIMMDWYWYLLWISEYSWFIEDLVLATSKFLVDEC